MSLVNGATSMALLFLFIGIANAALDVSINSLYYKDESEPNPNRKYGNYILWLSLGPPAGILVGGLFVYYSGFRMLLLAFAGLTLLSALSLRGFKGEKTFR